MTKVQVFNSFLNNGPFTDKLKMARILPILTNGEKVGLTDYSPKSVLQYILKILERILYNRLFQYLDEYGLLFKNLFGFRPRHSTVHATLESIDKLRELFINREYLFGTFTDMPEKIDTLHH